MDPSEFEGTVERTDEALSAGKLEELLSGPPKFVHLDLVKETGDIYLSIFNLKKLSPASIDPIIADIDEKALKLADLKEDYIKRRKALTAKVKTFSQTHLQNHVDNQTVEKNQELVDDCNQIIEAFKKEFDNLSSLARFSETAFLSSYKHMRELPDIVHIVAETLKACLKLEEVIKKGQEQLNIAESLLHKEEEDDSPLVTTARHSQEMEALRSKHEQDKEQLQQKHRLDMVDLKQQYEQELRSREARLQGKYEQEQLSQQALTDSLLSSKDAHIATLIQSLQEYQQKALLLEERSRAVGLEDVKRKGMEERLREALLSLGELRTSLDSTQSDLDSTRAQYQAYKQSAELEKAQLEEKVRKQRGALAEQEREREELQQELARRPPLDFAHLANKTGFVLSEDQLCTWSDLEAFICETMRRQGSELIALRVREGETSKSLSDLTAARDELQEKLRAAEEEMKELEREVRVAQQANRSMRQGGFRGDPSPRKMPPLESTSQDIENALDIARVLESEISTASSSSEQMLELLKGQRDRYQRSAQAMQGELESLRDKFERVQDEQTQLRNENLELYRRLRVLRVSSQNNQRQDMMDTMRSRRRIEDEDPIDNKYHAMYEEELSPFRVAELDKQTVLTKLGPVDQVTALVYKYVMQDNWTRHAFLCYLALVHLFALIYCFKMLNPELAGEVDAHLKARWSKETFDLPEHPDN